MGIAVPSRAARRAPARSPRVLVVDDDASVRDLLTSAVAREGLLVSAAGSLAEGIRLTESHTFELVLLDVHLGTDDGLELLGRIAARDAHPVVVIITGYGSIEGAVQAMRLGAHDYLAKPFELPDLIAVVERALERKQRSESEVAALSSPAPACPIDGVVGHSPKMREVYRMAAIVATTDATVLIQGETGTGKELVARAIHAQSPRAHGPWVVMNCGAVPETLLETEIFGHDKGAFTGATAGRPGRFERAEGGTIFLDEIGDMSMSMQVKLLRVLQERTVERVGGSRSITVDCRVIAATNHDLFGMVRRGEFREDLYYRLSVVPLEIPPLRERMEDLPLLAQHFLQKYRAQLGKPLREFSPMAMRRLHGHAWPGNIRELESCIKRAVILARGEVLAAEDIWIPAAAGGRPVTPSSTEIQAAGT